MEGITPHIRETSKSEYSDEQFWCTNLLVGWPRTQLSDFPLDPARAENFSFALNLGPDEGEHRR